MKRQLLAIGQDDGHDTVKNCFGYDAATDEYRYRYHKSKVSSGIQQVMSVGNQHSSAYEIEGKRFTVADGHHRSAGRRGYFSD